jgi:hypothetical protein
MAKRLVLTILLLIALPGAATAQSGKIISYVIRSGGKAVQFVLEHKGELGLHLLGATVFEVGKSSLGFAETTPAECNLYDAKVLTCPDKINPGLFLGSATPPEKLDPASPKDRARVQDLLRQNQTSLDGVLHRAPITLPKLTPLADPPALFADMPELNRLLKPLPQTATPPATPPNAVPYVPPTATLGLGVDTIPAWRRAGNHAAAIGSDAVASAKRVADAARCTASLGHDAIRAIEQLDRTAHLGTEPGHTELGG